MSITVLQPVVEQANRITTGRSQPSRVGNDGAGEAAETQITFDDDLEAEALQRALQQHHVVMGFASAPMAEV